MPVDLSAEEQAAVDAWLAETRASEISGYIVSQTLTYGLSFTTDEEAWEAQFGDDGADRVKEAIYTVLRKVTVDDDAWRQWLTEEQATGKEGRTDGNPA